VALRARLESRMKSRLEGEDWSGLEVELKEFARLAPRDQLAQRLTQLKDDAAHQQAELKTAILTKTAQAQITELQSMMDRYLEDDAFRAYSEALDKGRSERLGKASAQTKNKAATPRLVPPSDTNKDVPAPSAPAAVGPPPAPGRGRPKSKASAPPPSNQPF
jgi:hypothetical protein